MGMMGSDFNSSQTNRLKEVLLNHSSCSVSEWRGLLLDEMIDVFTGNAEPALAVRETAEERGYMCILKGQTAVCHRHRYENQYGHQTCGRLAACEWKTQESPEFRAQFSRIRKTLAQFSELQQLLSPHCTGKLSSQL